MFRKFILIFYLALIYSSVSKAQYPELDFPLQLGNRWQYAEFPGIIEESISIKDTTLNNGKKYTYIQGVLRAGFFRKEDSRVYAYHTILNEDELLYDFSKKKGDTLSITIRSHDTLVTTVYDEGVFPVFGEPRYKMAFITKDQHSFIYGIESVVDGIGFTGYSGEVFQYGLTGAVIDGTQYGTIVKIDDEVLNKPKNFNLSQNYPNPFNPSTKIKFTIPFSDAFNASQRTLLKIYDILGNELATLIDELKQPGTYEVEFDSKGFSSGIYFYRLQSGNFSETKKMILLR